MEAKMLHLKSVLVMLTVCMVIFIATAKAELLYLDQGVIYETIGDQYWFQDLSFFINQNYYEQMAAVSELDGNWKMADEKDIDNLWMYDSIEIGEAFTPSYVVIRSYDGMVSTGWRGRTNYIFTDDPVSYATPNIWKKNDIWNEKIIFGTFPDTATEFLGAWVVTDTCPLTSLELADCLYNAIEESEILYKIEEQYLNILRRIIYFIQKDKINNALLKIDKLSIKIQKDLDNGRIDSEEGNTFMTILTILRISAA
jgi:hypothetical protein